jgi:hypothetical protein
MRPLTLNEKISLKGIFAKRGLILPKLTMPSAVHFWDMLFGYKPISKYYKYQIK